MLDVLLDAYELAIIVWGQSTALLGELVGSKDIMFLLLSAILLFLFLNG